MGIWLKDRDDLTLPLLIYCCYPMREPSISNEISIESTVGYLIMHNIGTDPPPMHYENYARQAMSHNCDIGDSVTHWRRSFNEIKKYVSIRDCFAVKMSMHLKEAQNSQSC